MQELGVAVIGVGTIGSRRAHILAQMPQVGFLAVADTVEERAQSVAQQCGAGLWTADYREAIARPEVGAVIVATSEDQHVGPAVAAAELGKPLLVEKPLALTLKDADQIMAAARASGSEVLVGYTQRFQQRFLVTKEQVGRGSIGNVVNIFGKIYLNRREATRTISRCPITTPSVNTMTYLADLALWYLEGKRPVQVYAQSGFFIFKEQFNAPDFTWVTVTWDDGSVGILGVSWLIPEPHPSYIANMELELFGTKGFIGVDDSHRDFILAASPPLEQLSMGPPRDVAFGGSPMPGEWALGQFWGPLKEETHSFIAHVTTGRITPVATVEEGRRVLELTLAADRSAQEGRPVTLPLTESTS